jgi:class 3 adenylate cyclase
MVKYRFNTLEDFLISSTLTIDGQLDDGWGAIFPAKGREIEATILFADISFFSSRTLDLSPAETLIFVNNFFAWVTAEALREGFGIIDKYIGDEMMVVFSNEFGSNDPFTEAVHAARWISENDALSFMPHIGIASGKVIIGYVGTPTKYNCSVFGAPVALAARCASVKPEKNKFVSSSIVFPANEWRDRDFGEIFPPKKIMNPDGGFYEQPLGWEMADSRTVNLKNIGAFWVQEVLKRTMHFPTISAEDRAKLSLEILHKNGRYWPNTDET